MPDKIWNAASYTRLSRDDGDKAESNSITSQKEMIRDFIQRRDDLVIVPCSVISRRSLLC